jgi:hypothetical protein
VFDSDDIYSFNTSTVDEYMNLLVLHKKFDLAMQARKRFITFLIKNNDIDH